MRGKLKHWNDRGFGFIEDPAGCKDIFVHAKNVLNAERGKVQLQPGDLLEFEIAQSAKGPEARNVSVIYEH